MNKSNQIKSKINWLERGKMIEITLSVTILISILSYMCISSSQIASLSDFDIWHEKPLLSWVWNK